MVIDNALLAVVTNLSLLKLAWGTSHPDFNLHLGAEPRYSVWAQAIDFNMAANFTEHFGALRYHGEITL